MPARRATTRFPVCLLVATATAFGSAAHAEPAAVDAPSAAAVPIKMPTPTSMPMSTPMPGDGKPATGSPPPPAAPAHDMGAMPAHDMGAMPGHDMGAMSGHDMSAMPGMAHGGHAESMRSALGPFPMTREGSGTSWQPDTTPMPGQQLEIGGFASMAHGFVNLIADRQSGPRGDSKTFAQSMAMLMGQRAIGPGTLGLRAMASLDPAIGKSGYPLLFQTGETADGRTPLVDRQHPHDLLMELSGSYSLELGGGRVVFAYLGLPGEPALGPTAFMHRFSGMRNPEAPLTHHWLDSTHITFGVATLGASQGPVQIEASWFNGREPDPFRWNIETRRFDSWSARLSYNPLPELSMQLSHGDLKSPEQLEPTTRVARTTASVSHHLALGADQWATTLAWGLNRKSGPQTELSEPGWLLESTYVRGDRHTLFGRLEQVRNSELIAEGQPLHGQAFTIRKLTLGYIFDLARTGPVRWGVGGLIGLHRAPAALDPVYGASPLSTMLFVQGRV